MRRSVANVVRSAGDCFMLVFFVEKQWMPPSIMNYRSDTIVMVFTIILVLDPCQGVVCHGFSRGAPPYLKRGSLKKTPNNLQLH